MPESEHEPRVLSIDAGGTMTDTFIVDRDGDFVVGKAQTTPDNESVGFMESVRDALGYWQLTPEQALPKIVTGIYSGTAMINRLIERKGRRVGCIVTAGCEDYLRLERAIQTYLGYSYSDRLHVATHHHNEPLVPRSLMKGVRERIDLFGDEAIPLYEEEARTAARQLLDENVEGIVVSLPDGSGALRSFSMANLPGDGRIELIIKRYEEGRFSRLLGGELAPGDELAFRGPYGAFRLRESERDVLMIAGGSGMAPILCLLRDLAARGSGRRVRFFYGGRTERDLFNLELISRLGAQLGDFRFEPVTGEFVHEAAERYRESGELAEFEAYMCGPPPMIDAALEMLTERHGHGADLIFWDKFTTSAEAEALR